MKIKKVVFMTVLAGLLITSFYARAENATFNNIFDKGFRFQTDDGDYSLQFKTRIQLRYANSMREGSANDQQSFMARRIYFTGTGSFLTKNLTYNMTLQPTNGGVAADTLYYSWLNYKFMDASQVLFGLHKLNFNREEMTSSGKQQFVDRSLANERFNLDRSLGLVWHGKAFDKKLEYYLTVANGRSTRANLNGNQEMLYIARVAYNPLGEFGYSESDTDNTQDLLLSVGLGGTYFQEETAVSATQDDVLMGNADFTLKFHGFSFQSEVFYRNTDPGAAASVRDAGYYAQAGYFLIPKKFEIAVRASSLFDDMGDNGSAVYFNNGSLTGLGGVNDGVDEAADADNEHEFSAALNYFFKGHNLKLTGQYTFMLDGQAGTTVNNHIAMLQAQLDF